MDTTTRLSCEALDESFDESGRGEPLQRDSRFVWDEALPYTLPGGAASVFRGTLPSVVHVLSDSVPRHAIGMSPDD